MTIRIGISVVTHQGQNIWQNGLGQNVVFLGEALQRLPFVESVSLIDVGDQNMLPPQVDASAKGMRIMRTHDATDHVDVIFEMGGALDTQWLDLMRARGKKVVYYCCGQPYVGLVESPVFDKPVHVMRPDRYDEIWLMAKDRLSIPMMRTLHRCAVHLVPFIWHPQFLEQRIAEVSEHGLHYGYQPRAEGSLNAHAQRQGFRVSIFEPNISVVKTSSIPMLACEEAYRSDPSSVSHMHVLNTLHMKDHPTLVQMANSLNIVKTARQPSTGATILRASWRNSPMLSCRINGATTRIIFISTCCMAAIRSCTTRLGSTPGTTTRVSTRRKAGANCCARRGNTMRRLPIIEPARSVSSTQ